jgi:hypothetical protein
MPQGFGFNWIVRLFMANEMGVVRKLRFGAGTVEKSKAKVNPSFGSANNETS